MSPWTRAAARLNHSLDGYFGEAVDVLRPSPGRLLASNEAAVRLAGLTAIVSESPEQLGSVRGRAGFTLDVKAGEVVASFARTQFGDPADWPQRGELLRAADRPVAATYEVSSAALDDGDRVHVCLVRTTS